MALKNYTTTVPVEKTVSEIHISLAKHGARKIMFDYDDDGRVQAICFSILTPDGEQAVKLPANAERVREVLRQQKNAPKRTGGAKIDDSAEQAERVAWRIVRDWMEAQLAILETQMVEIDQVFLPYFVNRAGQTLYECYAAGRLLLPE
ncbi:MAG: hypothetical protein MJ074_06645 [Oscillospiraceae bacterium]|nr:hypothetical protein [Oscillospiraceae bacterium]